MATIQNGNYIVSSGATIKCSEGSIEVKLIATPNPGQTEAASIATVLDHKATTNIPPFGVCAKDGAPCTPDIKLPWVCKHNTILHHTQVLTSDATAACSKGGKLEIVKPGQTAIVIDGS